MSKCMFCGNEHSFLAKEKVICNIICDGSGNFVGYADGDDSPMVDDILETIPPFICLACGASYNDLDRMDSSTLESAPSLFIPILGQKDMYHMAPFRSLNDMVQLDHRICSLTFCDQNGTAVDMPKFSIPAVRDIIKEHARIVPDIYCRYSVQEQVVFQSKKEC